jgi:hypothetical protein
MAAATTTRDLGPWRVARGLYALLLLVVFAIGAPAGADSRARRTAEYDLKGAFLFNFTQFVDWPSDAFAARDSPFTIAIVGDDPFGLGLDEMVANELAHDRKIVVRRYKAVEELDDCQLLFVGISEPGPLGHALSVVAHRRVLTVGETRAFTARSGMITFELSQRRLRLKINVAEARAAGLTISSKLLRQAEIVGPGSAE